MSENFCLKDNLLVTSIVPKESYKPVVFALFEVSFSNNKDGRYFSTADKNLEHFLLRLYWVGKKYFKFSSKIFFLFFKLKSTPSFQQYMLHCCLRLVTNALAMKESGIRRNPGTSVQKT